jgi:hypothetical protein
MIHVDPAHPAFERLPRRQQAMIYFQMGWTIEAIIDEFDVNRRTAEMWRSPEQWERAKAYRRTPEHRAKVREQYHQKKAEVRP